MPQVSIHSAGGHLDVAYTISTPTSPNAKTINPALPTILLLHPLFLGQASLHYQFADPRLRRFNLIALDLRNFGDSVGPVKPTHDMTDAVDDVVKFMEALALPPLHLVGINLGALVAMELAALWPQRAVSLTLISPPAMQEPADAAHGRREILECWTTAFDSEPADELAMLDAVTGALQLGLSGAKDPLIKALVNLTLAVAKNKWMPPNLETYERSTVLFFTERAPPTLRGIACPVLLVHCAEDIAYARAGTEELRDSMLRRGVESVRMVEVPGAPQWGHITHPKEINQLIHDHVSECASEPNFPGTLTMKAAPISPFAAVLADAGFRAGKYDEESDSDAD
ncbi:Alpha/Beta hydrolase protein [Mycena amicta]|nr:Alpha/Beta hydrolase protein [Mycena amicta]KAJ7053719.1 Alpha/Beta hydrolase protein [Mycena amicta]